MNTHQAKALIDSDPDFIYSKRFNNSLKRCLERYPNEVPNKIIAQVLLMTEEEVEDTYLQIIKKLQQILKVEP